MKAYYEHVLFSLKYLILFIYVCAYMHACLCAYVCVQVCVYMHVCVLYVQMFREARKDSQIPWSWSKRWS